MRHSFALPDFSQAIESVVIMDTLVYARMYFDAKPEESSSSTGHVQHSTNLEGLGLASLNQSWSSSQHFG
jgi:hypothetical protein